MCDLILTDLPPDQQPLSWHARMKIAYGSAQGLEYLHEKANPPIIYRDLKSSNILLDENFNPKLSDFGLAKLGPTGDKAHVSSRVMGTYGYCAPEYARTGHLTVKSDVYSFGVVLLELITGRRVIDTARPKEEQNLVAWVCFVSRVVSFEDLTNCLARLELLQLAMIITRVVLSTKSACELIFSCLYSFDAGDARVQGSEEVSGVGGSSPSGRVPLERIESSGSSRGNVPPRGGFGAAVDGQCRHGLELPHDRPE